MITKCFNAKDLTVNPSSREIVAVISTDAVDRDGEVVLPNGLEKAQYSGNPVVLYGHDSSSLPIGKTLWIKSDGNKVIAKYRVSDKTQFARDVFGLLQDGILRAHSIGFTEHDSSPPTTKEIETRPDWKDARKVIRSWSLLEFSVVPIPCNPEALACAVAKCCHETKQFLGKAFEAAEAQEQQEQQDCWEWEQEEEETKPTVVEETPIAQPKYCRSWRQIESKIKQLLDARMSGEEIMAKLKGQA
jgi:phage head maturation protease